MKCRPILLTLLSPVTLADHTTNTLTVASPEAITVTILPTQVIAGGARLTRNAPGILISNTPISLGSTALVIGTSTIPFPTSNAVAPIYTVASDLIVTAGPAGVAVAGNTISNRGPAVTLSAEAATLSLGSFGLVIQNGAGASTLLIPTVQPLQSVFTFGGGQAVTEQYGRIVFPGAGSNNLSIVAATGTTAAGLKGNGSSTQPFLGAAVARRSGARLELGVLCALYLTLIVLRG